MESTPEPRTAFRLELTWEELEQLRQEAQRGELELVPEESKPAEPESRPLGEARFVETLATTVIVSVAWLVARLVDDWLKRRGGGLVIDLSQEPPTIRRSRDLPPGMVMKKDKQGQVSLAWQKEESRESLVDWLSVSTLGLTPGA